MYSSNTCSKKRTSVFRTVSLNFYFFCQSSSNNRNKISTVWILTLNKAKDYISIVQVFLICQSKKKSFAEEAMAK